MSPENDETRWIGIRPTNPKEDIPITLDGEVAHVIVDSGGGGLKPGVPLIATFFNTNAMLNQWYTVINLAVGAGHVQKIHIGGDVFAYDIETKITIDGGAAVTYTMDINTSKMWLDLQYNLAQCKEVPIYLIRYSTSLKIEIRHTIWGGRDLIGLVSYLPD